MYFWKIHFGHVMSPHHSVHMSQRSQDFFVKKNGQTNVFLEFTEKIYKNICELISKDLKYVWQLSLQIFVQIGNPFKSWRRNDSVVYYLCTFWLYKETYAI